MSEKNRSFFIDWGWVYWSGFLYHTLLRLLHGKAHGKMYEQVANMVGDLSILDLCCGDGQLARKLSHERYAGIEINPRFVRNLRCRGLHVVEGDVRIVEYPSAQCAVLVESFYHFLPDGKTLINKILSLPFQKVIIVESMSHWSDHSASWISAFAKWSTRVRGREFIKRLSPGEFKEMLRECGFVKFHELDNHLYAIWERGKGS